MNIRSLYCSRKDRIIFLVFSWSFNFVFVVGVSGDIGSGVVRGLITRNIDATAYVRNESKAKKLFKDELLTGHLKIVVGISSSIEVYTKVIEGHTRLCLLTVSDVKRPISMTKVKETFSRIAYEKGVRQIVDLSSFTVHSFG